MNKLLTPKKTLYSTKALLILPVTAGHNTALKCLNLGRGHISRAYVTINLLKVMVNLVKYIFSSSSYQEICTIVCLICRPKKYIYHIHVLNKWLSRTLQECFLR